MRICFSQQTDCELHERVCFPTRAELFSSTTNQRSAVWSAQLPVQLVLLQEGNFLKGKAVGSVDEHFSLPQHTCIMRRLGI
jgi:hypothetical protein